VLFKFIWLIAKLAIGEEQKLAEQIFLIFRKADLISWFTFVLLLR
jgi:hypothetical protein